MQAALDSITHGLTVAKAVLRGIAHRPLSTYCTRYEEVADTNGARPSKHRASAAFWLKVLEARLEYRSASTARTLVA